MKTKLPLTVLSILLAITAGCSKRSKPATTTEDAVPAPAPQASTPAPSETKAPVATPQGPAPITFVPFMTGLPEAGMWKCDPLLVDVNGDGIRDLTAIPRLFVSGLGDGPRFWLGSKSGAWTQSSEGLDTGERSCGGGLDLDDINGDGKLDLAVADHCQGVFVYLGDGQGKWNMVTRQMFPQDAVANPERANMYQGAEDLALGDMNGDGHLDIVAAASDLGGISLYLGDGTGANWTRTCYGLPDSEWATRVQLVDMNGDQTLDVVASYADGPRVWHNDGQGKFTAASQGLPSPIMRGIYTGLQVGDINRDGMPDFAVANWVDGPEVYIQQADHSWTKMPDVFPEMQGGAVGLDLGDLDNDGKLDMVVSGRLTKDAGYVRGVYALLGDGTGRFRFIPNSGLPQTGLAACAGVTIADIDADGHADVAVGSGLVVETGETLSAPSIPQRLLVWRGKGPAGR